MNGALIGTKEDVTSGDITTDLPLIIGNNQNTDRNFKGLIDDVRLYNYALTADEVEDLFDSYNIVTKEVVAHWKFDEASGTTAADENGLSNGT